MSTRAQVIIKDQYDELWFYRHSDGYPEGTMPSLKKFLAWVKEGKIRDNVERAAGWLILIGAQEYGKVYDYKDGKGTDREKTMQELFEPQAGCSGWKVGAYEPCAPEEHGDIEYLYTVDLVNKTITHETR